MKAAEVLAAVAQLHPPPRYATFTELSTAAGMDPARRLDLWVIDTWPSGRLERITYEVKVSLGDYRAEIANPRKRGPGMLLSNRFIFAVPAGLVAVEQVPYDCGLVEVNDAGVATVTVPAPWRDTAPPPWGFLASIAARGINPREQRRAYLATEERDLSRRVAALRRELDHATQLRRQQGRTGDASTAV